VGREGEGRECCITSVQFELAFCVVVCGDFHVYFIFPHPVSQPPAAVEYRAPYVVNSATAYQPNLVFHNNAWKTANQIIAETNAMPVTPAPLTDQFPVSTGLQHKSSVVEGVAVGMQGGVAGQHSAGCNIFPGKQVG
jgi:hypothetical protein